MMPRDIPRLNVLPGAETRISDDVGREILRLHDLYNVSQSEIARRLGVHRQTVARVVSRTRGVKNALHDLSAEYARAISVYSDIQRRSLLAAEDAILAGKSPVPALAEARQCQTRLDELFGLQPPNPADPESQLQAFRDAVLETVPPEIASQIAQRLIGAAQEHDRG